MILMELRKNFFLGKDEIWKIANKHPRIKKKVQSVIQLYEKINPVFNEKYFKNINS